MYNLTEDEKAYLRIAYNKGYRWVANDSNEDAYLYQMKPIKIEHRWAVTSYYTDITLKSLVDFDISWKDDEPTKIANLLGIDDTDWSKVKPFTPVWVKDNGKEHWYRRNFIAYEPSNKTYPFKTTIYNAWTHDGDTTNWGQCKLATQEELDEVTGGNQA